jgi:hypothetical protein
MFANLKWGRLIFCFIGLWVFGFCFSPELLSQKNSPEFNVVAFYNGINDRAHVSFVNEANTWFSKIAATNNFTYQSTQNWDNLNTGFLSHFQLVIFLDSRPDSSYQRVAFQTYMENGGAWIGFHFCAFANETQNRLILQGLYWLARSRK